MGEAWDDYEDKMFKDLDRLASRLLECIHGMEPTWCAQCQGHKLPDEEEKIEDSKIIKNILGWKP